ncbi:hypothetical protein MTR67_036182 [Solanum verrucosum]|uniref:Uncharacterized protein n=1 Tax=Solanum verrucosum TaxID=315347 RepID=A0AAF0ZKY2_SOLVR|nr:hypothetical protein MTR67_036182 [Solanum verrucosum]
MHLSLEMQELALAQTLEMQELALGQKLLIFKWRMELLNYPKTSTPSYIKNERKLKRIYWVYLVEMMGSNRREEGSVMVKNSNVFAALDTLRKKKKSDKEKSKGSSKKEQEPEVLWAPAPLTVKSWADVDDEDDDDYYATTAPLQSFVGSIESGKKPEPVESLAYKFLAKLRELLAKARLSETESEDDLLDEDEDVENNDHESEVPEHAEPVGQKIEASPAPKEAERQLSKKERRKKELAELEALLADFGVEQKENGPEDLPDVANEKKEGQPSEDVEKKNSGATEPKSAKKKKKKDKASKEVKESEDQPNNVDATTGPEETGGAGSVEDVSTVDMKERLKRVASAKKKKSGKETDAAARAAAIEAAARNSKLAAAKKKEKSHYNQQPTR